MAHEVLRPVMNRLGTGMVHEELVMEMGLGQLELVMNALVQVMNEQVMVMGTGMVLEMGKVMGKVVVVLPHSCTAYIHPL